MKLREHKCVNGAISTEPSEWLRDGRGIELCRACPLCRTEKLRRYRPEILKYYDQSDVDEPIEPEEG